GYPTSKMFTENHVSIPIVEAKCQFQSPLFFDDEVCVHSSVVELRDKAFKIQHVFLKEGSKMAEGYEIRVWASFQSGKPKAVPIPEAIRSAMTDIGMTV
ncbi:thioesterase superfamily protein, partial [Anoxybacillus vitaminiphilus]